jgi:probable rRNA maturation factor
MSARALFHLSTQQASRRPTPGRSQVRRWVAAVLAVVPVTLPVEIVIRFCDAREARGLNRQFRGHDYPTNVLTFVHDAEGRIAADIILCVPVLEKEARAQRKPVKNHTAHLVVHGMLHALGFDHESADQAEAMESLEVLVLARFSIANPYLAPA